MSARSVALALVALAGPAAAQETPEDTARRVLIAQAEESATAADHARALELARRASAIRSSPSLTCFLAREHRALDQLVEALDLARACVRSVDADPTLHNRDGVRQACEAVRASVEPRVGRLEVSVAGEAPDGLVLRLDGRVVLPALRGVAMPAMPGEHRVEAEAPGYLRATREGVVTAGDLLRVELRLEREPPPTPPPPVAVTPRVVARTPPAARRPIGPGPWIIGGAGIASLVFAGVAYDVAMSARSERDLACRAEGCGPEALPLDARYVDWLAATNVGAVAGGALLGGAVVWYLVARLTGAPESAPRPTLTAGRPEVGVAF